MGCGGRGRKVGRGECNGFVAIAVRYLFEDAAGGFDFAVVREQAQGVLERVEVVFAIDVVAVPVSKPAYALFDGGVDGAVEPFGLLLVR